MRYIKHQSAESFRASLKFFWFALPWPYRLLTADLCFLTARLRSMARLDCNTNAATPANSADRKIVVNGDERDLGAKTP